MTERVPVPILNDLAPGGFFYGGYYVVEFDSDSLWYETSLTIAALALKQGTKVEYHVFQHFPTEAVEAFSRLGVDATKFEKEGLLSVIDSYTQTMEYEGEKKTDGRPYRIAKTRDKPLDLVKSAENWAKEAKAGYTDRDKRWLHIDDNTGIFLQYNDEKTLIDKWRTAILPYSVRARETPHFLAFAKGAASDEFYSQFEASCDGILDLTAREEGGRVENYIRVRTLRGKTFDSSWHHLQLMNTGEVRLVDTPSQAAQRRLAAIMFTDVVGYTALSQRNETLALELLEEHRDRLRPLFSKHNGREVKTIGDAFLIEFASALEAVRCAFEIQRALHELNQTLPTERRVVLRIGVHIGDVVESRGDVSGDAVNMASRIEPLAEDGGVCLTRQVYDQIQNKFDLPLVNLGPKVLKNVAIPVEVFKMAMPWDEEKSLQ